MRRTIILNDRVLLDEPNPYKIDRYPIVPCLGYFNPDTPYYAYKFRGLVRDLRDCQYLFNRLKVSDLDILESQQQGLKVKKGALVTPDDSLNTGHGRVLSIDPKFQMTDVEPMQIIPPSPVMLQMEDMLQATAHRIVGIDPAAMGMDVQDKAGIISMMRQAASARNIQKFFDQFDEMQRLCGDIIVEMIQKNWTYGKVRQVIGEEPTAEFDNKAFFKYGAKIIQGMLTETQQQLNLAQLLHLREVTGINIPSSAILEATTIQNKEKLMEAIDAQEKSAAEQAQKMEELQLQQMQIDNQAKISYAHSQEGLYLERVAKIQTDKAVAQDKLRKSHQEDTHSLLNLVKAIKEIQGMDIDHIARQVQVLSQLDQSVNSDKDMPLQKIKI